MIEGHPGRVLLGIPSTGHDISSRFFRSFIELDRYDSEWAAGVWASLGEPDDVSPLDVKILTNYVCVEASSNIAKQRNRIVDFFMTEPEYAACDWLWMCDTDMVFPPDTLHRMVATAQRHDIKVLGALCVIVNEEGAIPTMFVDDEQSVTAVMLDYEDNTIAQLAATGTGCLLIHRDVLTKMQQDRGGSKNAWFGFDIVHTANGKEWALGEDITFCLRARESGFPAHVDTTLHVGHHKGPKVWVPEDVRKNPTRPIRKESDEAARA